MYSNLSDTIVIPCSVYFGAKFIFMDLIIFHQPCDHSVKYWAMLQGFTTFDRWHHLKHLQDWRLSVTTSRSLNVINIYQQDFLKGSKSHNHLLPQHTPYTSGYLRGEFQQWSLPSILDFKVFSSKLLKQPGLKCSNPTKRNCWANCGARILPSRVVLSPKSVATKNLVCQETPFFLSSQKMLFHGSIKHKASDI